MFSVEDTDYSLSGNKVGSLNLEEDDAICLVVEISDDQSLEGVEKILFTFTHTGQVPASVTIASENDDGFDFSIFIQDNEGMFWWIIYAACSVLVYLHSRCLYCKVH